MGTANKSPQSNINRDKHSISKIFSDTIKSGIVKSNLIAILAGLSMALYVFDMPLTGNILKIILSLIGASLVIASAGTLNNLYDKDIDAIMERTKLRPTVTGQVSTKTGLSMGVIMGLSGGILLYIAAPLAAAFGLAGLFLYLVPYTIWTKRRTIYNTDVGSISGAIPPLIGWSVLSDDIFHFEIWALVITLLLWQMPHFYAIAIRRFDEYKAAGVPMLPVVKGLKRTYVQTNVYLVLLLLSSLLFWPLSPFVALAAAAISLIWLIISLSSYNQLDTKKWAKNMFVFSIQHITLIFLIIIAYSLIAYSIN